MMQDNRMAENFERLNARQIRAEQQRSRARLAVAAVAMLALAAGLCAVDPIGRLAASSLAAEPISN